MRSRPEIVVRAPHVAHPGEALDVEVVLRAGTRTPVRRVTVALEGEERLRLVSPNEVLVARRALAGETQAILGEAILEPGETVHRLRFALPPAAPPSDEGYLIERSYAVRVHADIPWWPDAVETVDVLVRPAPAPRPPAAPTYAAEAERGLPLLEVALDDQAFAPGETVTGAVAFGHVGERDIQALELALVAREALDPDAALRRASGRAATGWPRQQYEALHLTTYRDVRAADAGLEIPLGLALPADARLSFDDDVASLAWSVLVALTLSDGATVSREVPITVVPLAGPRRPGPRRRPVGAGRWRAVWREVAAATGLRSDGDLRLVGTIEPSLPGAPGAGSTAPPGTPVSLTVRLAASADEGHGLVADLGWDGFAIDLEVRPRRHPFESSFSTGDERFDDRFRARGREPEQVAAALTPAVREALLAFDAVTLLDDHALARRDAPAADADALADFVRAARALGAALSAAAPLVPPPRALSAADAQRWRRFAAATGARLALGGLRLRRGMVDGVLFDLDTRLSRHGAPVATHLGTPLPPPLAPGVRPGDDTTLTAVPAARAVLDTLPPEAAVHLLDDVLGADLPALADPEDARPVIRALGALSAILRGGWSSGPYR